MKKVLITGISGFAGSFLAEYLLSKSIYDITGTYFSSEPTLFAGKAISLRKIDLNDATAVQEMIQEIKPDIIFHLAALTSPAESFEDPTRTIMNNVTSQVNLLEAVRKENMLDTRVIVVSSADVYGMVNPKDIPIDEETHFRPGNPYAISKITQDLLGLQYFLAYKLQIIRVRPFNHIGPRQQEKFAISAFAKQIAEIEKKKREPVLKVGNLAAKKDFTDVRDIVRAYVLLVEKGVPGEVYNIGSNQAFTIDNLLKKLLSFTTVQIRVEQDQALFRPIDTPELICDNKKLVEATGWRPEIAIDDSLRSVLDYWRTLV